MRARVSASSLRRLNQVEAQLFTDDGQSRGGVLLVPAIEHDLDAWERRAIDSQQRLVSETQAGIDRQAPFQPIEQPMPASLVSSHTHKPDPYRSQAPVPKRPPLPSKLMR
jgi:hypothetical protein